MTFCVQRRKLEIAHFWQDVCLSIRVAHTRAQTGFEGPHWIDAGNTAIRLREVPDVPRVGRDPSVTLWLPGLLILACIFTAFAIPTRPHELLVLVNIALPSRSGGDAGRCLRGSVIVITNRTAHTLDVRCHDWTVNSPPELAPGMSLQATPDAVASCLFSWGRYSWTYDFDVRDDELERERQWPRRCSDGCDPYKYFLVINDWGTLLAAPKEPSGFHSLPARPSWIRGPEDPFQPPFLGSLGLPPSVR